jgi:hypothetical protein
MKPMPTSSMPAQRTLAAARWLVVIACVCIAPAVLAQANDPQPVTTEPAKETTGKQCEWACERWTKMCNVDPRGVYKCRRTCAKFGEICE